MNLSQFLLLALFGVILYMLVRGKYRHDLVAAGGLFTAIVLGLVPQSQAFSGFSNPAVVIVALVLVASRAFENSGALGLLTDRFFRVDRPISLHIATTAGLGAALSAVINNVAELAMLMPLDIQAARKAGRPPGLTLMPLAFGTILGGMITLIGTPPNIIASAIRAERLGEPYQMFDFLPVGIAVALSGLAFVALIGWRLVPKHKDETARLMEASSFMAELLVPAKSQAIGQLVAELDDTAQEADVLIVGLIRNGKRHLKNTWAICLQENDILIVEGSAESIAGFIKVLGLQDPADNEAAKAKPAIAAKDKDKEEVPEEERGFADNAAVVEAVVRADSRLIGYSAIALRLRTRFSLTLLGISRAGTLFRDQLRARRIEPGDVLLLTGTGATQQTTLDQLGVIPINKVSIAPASTAKIAIAVGCFVAAIIVATLGWLSFAVSIAIATAIYGATKLVSAREFYHQIDWPIIVMLACLLPLGEAFDDLGCTALIADALLGLADGGSPVMVLCIFMIAVMTLSDVLNNVATIVIAAPLAFDLSGKLGVNPDTFLMGAAIATSCAFLSPIGHKNNMLIMGPGGFRFSDYWRMGLPLEILVLCISIPMLMLVWPL